MEWKGKGRELGIGCWLLQIERVFTPKKGRAGCQGADPLKKVVGLFFPLAL